MTLTARTAPPSRSDASVRVELAFAKRGLELASLSANEPHELEEGMWERLSPVFDAFVERWQEEHGQVSEASGSRVPAGRLSTAKTACRRGCQPYSVSMISRAIPYFKSSWLGLAEFVFWGTMAVLAARDGAMVAAYGFGFATCLLAGVRLNQRRRNHS
jgi:hypothetical protein